MLLCPAQDLIITSPLLPAPLACIVASSTDSLHSLDSSAFLDRWGVADCLSCRVLTRPHAACLRCRAMAATFRTCLVALPYVLGAHPAVLQLLCDSRCARW